MKLPCCVVKDLLPLYIEDIELEETKKHIMEHLAECVACQAYSEQLKSPNISPAQFDVPPLKMIKAQIIKKRVLTAVLAVLLTMVLLLFGIRFLNTPIPLSYDGDLLSFTTEQNGDVFVTINASHSSRFVDSFYSEELGGTVYYISAYTNNFSRIMNSSVKDNTFLINRHNEKVAQIFYSANDGTEDIPVYLDNTSEQNNSLGDDSSFGSVTLPHLALRFYVAIAAILIVILAIFILIFRKKATARKILLRACTAPLSLIVSCLIITGFSLKTYNMYSDSISILIMTVLLFGLCLTAEQLLKRRG